MNVDRQTPNSLRQEDSESQAPCSVSNSSVLTGGDPEFSRSLGDLEGGNSRRQFRWSKVARDLVRANMNASRAELSPLDEYRRVKSDLLDKMSQRFADFLKIERVERGERRFETSDDQQRWAEVVSDCLTTFTPWSTQGCCSQFVTANGGNTKLASSHIIASTDKNEVEMRCCHILIEPACYSRLLKDHTPLGHQRFGPHYDLPPFSAQ